MQWRFSHFGGIEYRKSLVVYQCIELRCVLCNIATRCHIGFVAAQRSCSRNTYQCGTCFHEFVVLRIGFARVTIDVALDALAFQVVAHGTYSLFVDYRAHKTAAKIRTTDGGLYHPRESMQKCRLRATGTPAVADGQITNHSIHRSTCQIGCLLVLLGRLLLFLHRLRLLQRERVAQRLVGGAGVAAGQGGDLLLAVGVFGAVTGAGDDDVAGADDALGLAALAAVLGQALAPTQVTQAVADDVLRQGGHGIGTAVAHAGAGAAGVGALAVVQVGAGEAGGLEGVFVRSGGAGDGGTRQVGVAGNLDVKASTASGDAALAHGALVVVVEGLLALLDVACHRHAAHAQRGQAHAHAEAGAALFVLVRAAVLQGLDVELARATGADFHLDLVGGELGACQGGVGAALDGEGVAGGDCY